MGAEIKETMVFPYLPTQSNLMYSFHINFIRGFMKNTIIAQDFGLPPPHTHGDEKTFFNVLVSTPQILKNAQKQKLAVWLRVTSFACTDDDILQLQNFQKNEFQFQSRTHF